MQKIILFCTLTIALGGLTVSACTSSLHGPGLDDYPERNLCNTLRYLSGEWPLEFPYSEFCEDHESDGQRCIFVACMVSRGDSGCGDVATGYVDYYAVMQWLLPSYTVFSDGHNRVDPDPEHTCWRHASRNDDVETCLAPEDRGRAHLTLWCDEDAGGTR